VDLPRFLAWEDRQKGKHEFDGTRIIEMTGGSRAHQRIVANLLRLLADSLDPDHFDAVQEMRIDAGGAIRYPDIAVVTAPVAPATRALQDAVVLFEVLSEDTAETDLGPKLTEYARLPSIRRYVTIEQRRMDVTSRERTRSGWTSTELPSGNLNLPELGISLLLQAINRRVGL
jgi:Uma2 family endonuclease